MHGVDSCTALVFARKEAWSSDDRDMTCGIFYAIQRPWNLNRRAAFMYCYSLQASHVF